MKYMILRRADALTETGSSPQLSAALLAALETYQQQMRADGILRCSERLHPSGKGARLTISKGEAKVIDGPFTETKELIAGFGMVEVPSKQEAIDLVKRLPQFGGDITFEIREVVGVDGCPDIEAAVEEAAVKTARVTPELKKDARRYMVLLRSDSASETGAIPDARTMDAQMAFNRAGVREGRILAGGSLRASALGTRVSFAGEKISVIDGPFAEVKELIAGFWLIRANSLQDAIAWAGRAPYPTAVNGEVEVEVRVLFEAEDFAATPSPERKQEEENLRAGLAIHQ